MNGPEGPNGLAQQARNRGWMWNIQIASDEPAITVEDVVRTLPGRPAWRSKPATC